MAEYEPSSSPDDQLCPAATGRASHFIHASIAASVHMHALYEAKTAIISPMRSAYAPCIVHRDRSREMMPNVVMMVIWEVIGILQGASRSLDVYGFCCL